MSLVNKAESNLGPHLEDDHGLYPPLVTAKRKMATIEKITGLTILAKLSIEHPHSQKELQP